ncbi:hypothetical protein QTP86_030323 [Hemibagrus guttatus]|nr:hypothetical protein QTP86_030323 [Hemibagrus guttatus]
MHHGGGPPNAQRNPQRSKSFTGPEAEEQQQQPITVTQPQQQATAVTHPQSPVTTFATAASPAVSAPQSPNYQIKNWSPVASQNMNITLQNQQITLTPVPLQSPASPSFQHQAPHWRIEHGSSSYIQVTSPLPQAIQPQSPTQHSPVPLQAVTRPGTALGVCAQSPTRFVEAGIMVRQINLSSPPGSGHFVYQDNTGLTQLAPTTVGTVQLAAPAGTPASVRERRLSQPHSQTGGTIHHLGPQSPVASGAALPALTSPGHITTSNLPPQISSIIQGQLRPVVTVSGMTSFGTVPPSSPSRSTANPLLTPKKVQPKKLEEIAPPNTEVAQLRKQCLEHHNKKMENLKDVFKDYLIELFFLQHLQGNMMDYLAFKKKPCVPLFTYLRQNDLDLEDEEEEEEQSEVINDEVKVVTGKDGQTVTPVAIATQLPPNVSAAFSTQPQFQAHPGVAGGNISNPVDMEAFKRQQALAQADQAKRSRIEVVRHGMIFQHPVVAPLGSPGVPLQQLMPTAQGGMPPTPQAIQIGGQNQNQQQYDPSKGPPVQNAASLHTPPPQLPGRIPQATLPMATLPLALSQSQPVVLEQQCQVPGGQLQAQVKLQGAGAVLTAVNPHPQLQMQLQIQQQQTQPVMQPGQATVTLVRPGAETTQPAQRLIPNLMSSSVMSTTPLSSLPSPLPSTPVRTPVPHALSPASHSKLMASNGTTALKISTLNQSSAASNIQESPQDKQAEQAKLESQVHQRIAELRKEGQWSASRLPKLQEASRPKSHWDYLLEEMQWMAADFAQERRWKMAAAKKLVRTCARYHVEVKKAEERKKMEEDLRLRNIASVIAREVDFFWSNIEQVVEIKLHLEILCKRQKALRLQKSGNKGQHSKPAPASGEKDSRVESGSTRKRKTSTSLSDEEAEDEESTIEEQEAMEVAAEQKKELVELTKEAEVPLEALVKKYAGAYAEGFEWPKPACQSEDEEKDEVEGTVFFPQFKSINHSNMDSCPLESPHEAVLIETLLSDEQYRGPERSSGTSGTDGKPMKDIAEVSRATDLILPKGSARTTPTTRLPVPSLLHGSLRDYQRVGVEWLANLHRKHLNGILADETGLGKTVQTVAYLAHLACHEGIWGPHLVVVRTCKLLNWEMEFKRWCPGLKILLYLGSKRERRHKRSWWSEPNSFHVCITSYKLLLKDQAHFLKRRWRHLVLDEVQLIKNMTEKHWETIFTLRSQQRILLINSPLQNTLRELWTMIHFLLPGITRSYLDFPIQPGADQNQDYCHKLVIRLHRMIQPFILRRSKRDVEKQLPKKYEHILKCRLSARQKSMYEDILTQTSAQEALKTGHFVSVLQVLMQLQRICNHPDLIQIRETSSSYTCQSLQYNTPSLVLTALQKDQWKTVDLSLFNLIGNEGRLTRFETTEALPKLRLNQQLIEEIHSSPDPPPRPKACKIKPMRLFQPVQYGTKPEGRLVPLVSTTQGQRSTATTTATPTTTSTPTAVAQNTQARGKSPVTTTSSMQASSTPGLAVAAASSTATSTHVALGVAGVGAVAPRPAVAPQPLSTHPLLPQRLLLSSQAQARLPSGDVVKVAQLASIAGPQSRIAQTETPVTLQFQGNKFTLSPSQLRQLTTGQPLQLQGNILQIVSTPGQPILRPPGSLVMQPMPQPVPVQNSTGPPAAVPLPTPAPPQAAVAAGDTATSSTSSDAGSNAKPSTNAAPQESSEERNRQLKERLTRLFSVNERRVQRSVLYGADLIEACFVTRDRAPPPLSAPQHSRWTWVGRDACLKAQQNSIYTTDSLRLALCSHTDRLQEGECLVKRLSCILPTAVAPPPHLYAANPPLPYSLKRKSFVRQLQEVSASFNPEIRALACPTMFELPDKHLLEMDSGKLEALSILLHKLKAEGRRVLIFTQMASMLDILEAFLDHRYFAFVRLDESLTHHERQDQIKVFNCNRQFFCAILTNRCCSAVGHVFDADTVVFYDTDLNPSMDARTQEWCDRVGRSKDIHIYRLESGNSIEEKLLKNGTKDLIREVAAQGTDYTLAFLTQRTIQDLFEVEAGSGEKVEEFVVLHQEPSPSESIPPHVARPYIQALNTITLQTLHPEEGLEKKVLEKEEKQMEEEGEVTDEASQLEELASVVEQLTPIERYALHCLEYLHIIEDEAVAKERIEASKRVWEMRQQQKRKREEVEQAALEDEEDLFTYTREDAYNMEYVFESADGQTEIMPLWTPPTPPQDDNDIYIDSVICLMYDSAPMSESKLPPVYVRKEHKRPKMDPSAMGRKKKKGHGEAVIPPRSLFDKASMLKVRREGKDQKKNFSLKQQAPFAKPLPSLVKPTMEPGQDNPEWLISEDWALLQAVKQLLELPLNLTIVSPAHTPNWDLVSDVVSSCSRIYRSPKQCRSRYENVIIPREEGKLLYEANPKKKTKSIYKTKNSRPLRTCQIYTQDDNATQIQLYNNRFELMKIIASKRSPPIKPLLGLNPFQKNPKHASVLAESGISYDKPLPPIQVASQRAERIAKEKKALAEQQRAQQLAQQQQTAGAAPGTPGATAQPQAQPQATTAGLQTTGVPQGTQQGAAAVPNTAVLASAIKTAAAGTGIQTATAVGGSMIVNTVASVPPGQFQGNKRLASPVIPGALPAAGAATAQVVHTQQRAVASAPAATPAEVVAIATSQGVRAVTPVTASTVVSPSLAQVPSQARPIVAQGVQLPQGKITQAQLQILRQQQLQQQQQQPQQQAGSPQIKAVNKPQQMHKQKLQVVTAPGQQTTVTQQPQQVQAAPTPQTSTQLTAVAAVPRAGAVLTGTTAPSLQVARLTRVPATGTVPAQAGQTAQVTLTKPPPVVSVPAVVSSTGVTTLPVTVAGISVAIGQTQKTVGSVVGPFQVQQVQQLLRQKQAAAQQKAAQPQQTQAAVQQKLATQQVAQAAGQGPQKVTYTTTQLQPTAIKTQYFTSLPTQTQKPAQQIQVAKLPQIVQQQIVSSPQQIQAQPQTVTLTQTAGSSPQTQVQVIPAGSASATQVVHQKLLQQQQQPQQQVVSTPAPVSSSQIPVPAPQSPAQQQSSAVTPTADTSVQQPGTPQPQPGKANARAGAAMRAKTPAKPSGGS